MKIEQSTIIKIASLGGTVLSLVGALLNSQANAKAQEKMIAEKVAKAIADQKK